jgi:hypothetical protein
MYVVDSDVLMQAKKQYYAFDLCPSFWEKIAEQHTAGNVISIDHVKQEIDAFDGSDPLKHWANNVAPAAMFDNSATAPVLSAYGSLTQWVSAQPNYVQQAVNDYASKADGWLCAYCRAHGHTLVTMEGTSPNSRARVMIPDVCNANGILCVNTYEMLRALGISF